ncbi:MAG: lasso peptide biosynthesis PqqD family chaperone [Nostocaceae cyanobacterium]|nr:lasso peptide biosynthesis PqqD family chaperone [Nostocaceae cyanobacterium]
MVAGNSKVVAVSEQISSELSQEAVILNLKSGIYYGLSEVGASIWNLIQEPKTINEIRDAIVAEYEVEPERCDRDILTLLQQLETEGLIEVRNEISV